MWVDLDENMKKSGSFVKNLFAYFPATVYLRLVSFQQVLMLAEHGRYIFVREVELSASMTGSKKLSDILYCNFVWPHSIFHRNNNFK